MSSFHPNRSDIVAGLALVLAMLSLVWASRGRPPTVPPTPSRSPDSKASVAAIEPFNPPSPSSASSGLTPLEAFSLASAEMVARASRSIVRVSHATKRRTSTDDDLELYFDKMPAETFGSGFVIDESGLVLTNYHVIRGAERVEIRSADNTTYPASLVGSDALTDLALLKVSELRLPALNWGDSRKVVSGQLAWAIGSPHGLDLSVSLGIISAVNRPTLLDSPFQDFLQTDASINPGSSGSPLLDSQGAIIGVNTAMAVDAFAGISFALPAHIAKNVVSQLRSNGSVPRGWIGVHLGSVTSTRAAMAGLEAGQGAYIESISAGDSVPAVEADLRVADICTAFEGGAVSGPVGLIRNIAAHPIGTTAKLTLHRAGQVVQVDVMIQTRPIPTVNLSR